MTDDELKKLLAKGLIPENLPKPFNSIAFSGKYDAYVQLLGDNKAHIPYKYDVYKKKYATRQFTLLNPYNFALLAKTLKDNWADVKATLDTSGISLTGVKFGDDEDKKAIKQMTKNQFQDTVFSKSSGMSVLLTTDIVEHYDATYTHSVAWAIHGKEEAKSRWKATHEGTRTARAAAKTVWDAMTGNVVDRVLRDGDEQQTHGIPTGPETSRIISEVILSAIDSEFVKQLQDNRISFVGGRYVDDYELYFESERDAEKALQILRDVLNRYRYKVSEPKTYVLSGPPIPVDEEWRRRLRQITPKTLLDAEEPYSLDGVMQAPGGPDEDTSGGFQYGGWTPPYSDEYSGSIMVQQMSMPFDLLLGRKTYDIFASYWPNKTGPIADPFNKATKYVVSSSSPKLDWEESVLIDGDVVAKLKELKHKDGPVLQVHGSGNLIQTLLKNDLVDELWLKIFPVTLGNGKRLFAEGTMPTAFELIESKTSPKGIIFANYRRSGEFKTGSFA